MDRHVDKSSASEQSFAPSDDLDSNAASSFDFPLQLPPFDLERLDRTAPLLADSGLCLAAGFDWIEVAQQNWLAYDCQSTRVKVVIGRDFAVEIGFADVELQSVPNFVRRFSLTGSYSASDCGPGSAVEDRRRNRASEFIESF